MSTLENPKKGNQMPRQADLQQGDEAMDAKIRQMVAGGQTPKGKDVRGLLVALDKYKSSSSEEADSKTGDSLDPVAKPYRDAKE